MRVPLDHRRSFAPLATRMFQSLNTYLGPGVAAAPVPSCSHGSRHTDVQKTALLRRRYREEAKYPGGEVDELLALRSEGDRSINPISMTRKEVGSRGAKEFGQAFMALRAKRWDREAAGSGGEPGVISGSHMMHPGACPTGVVSSRFSRSEYYPTPQTTASSTYVNPRDHRKKTSQMLKRRREFVLGEARDREAARGLVLEEEARKRAAFAVSLPVGPPERKARSSLSNMGTSFCFNPAIAFRTSAANIGTGVEGITAAPHNGTVRYGAFTQDFDLPHRRGAQWGQSLHAIGAGDDG